MSSKQDQKRTVKYIPQACKGKGAALSGDVTLILPSLPEKLRYTKEVGVNFDTEGKPIVNVDGMESLIKLIEYSKPHYAEVNLKKKDGTEIKTFDEMLYDPECETVVTEIAYALLNSFRVTKN